MNNPIIPIVFILIAGFLAFSVEAYAQSKVFVIENKIIFRPVKGKIGDTAVIVLPKISGLKDAHVLKRVQNALSYENIFERSLDDVRKEIEAGEPNGFRVGYSVNYNQNYLLDMTFDIEGMSAYPWRREVHKVIDLKTGSPLTADAAFKKSSLNQLVEKVTALKKAVEKEDREDEDRGLSDEDKEIILERIKASGEYALKDLNHFEVSDKGITFLYEYNFPHCIQALQPPSSYFISYQDLKTFINPTGPLGVFLNF